MAENLILEEEFSGEITLRFPPNKRLRIQVYELNEGTTDQPNLEDEAAVQAELDALLNDPLTFTGLGLTAEEIARSPDIGAWSHRTDSTSGAEFVREQRRAKKERRLRRDG